MASEKMSIAVKLFEAKRIQFLIAGSPNDAFCSQIGMFKLALSRLGEPYSNAIITAIFGDAEITGLPERWSSIFEGVQVVFADVKDFMKYNVFAQGDLRYEMVDETADIVMMFDADTVLVRAIPELLALSMATPALRAAIAHRPPYGDREIWGPIFDRYLGYRPPFDHEYALVRDKTEDGSKFLASPYYINQGVMFGTAAIFKELGPKMREIRHDLIAQNPNWLLFSAQIALTVALLRHDIPHEAIALRYNYPNRHTEADLNRVSEFENMAVLHYQNTRHYDRHKIFTSKQQFDEFLGIELHGSHLVFQDFVRNLTTGAYPFPD